MEEGLVDCVSITDFDSKLDALEGVWNAREDPYCGKAGPQFYRYFKQYKAPVVRHNMLRCYRETVGLGSPPAAYTTNASESVNAVIKQHVQYKASRWPEFNEKLRKLINSKHEEIVRSLSGRGLYRLTVQYSHLAIEPELWLKMRPDQRTKAVKRFESSSLHTSKATSRRKLLFSKDTSDSSSSAVARAQERQQQRTLLQDQEQEKQPPQQQQVLSVSAEESGINFLPLITLQMMWQKAEKLLNSENAITNAPGSDTKARMVLSQSSAVPHFVTTRDDGQFLCDSTCPQWVSSKICSHTIAAAEDSGKLCEFLQWCASTQPCPNMTALGMQGMPSNRGRKLSDRKRQRKRKADSDPDVFVPSPALATTTQPHTTTGVSSYHWEADQVANISTSLYMCPALPPYVGQPGLPVPPTCSAAVRDTTSFGSSAGASSSNTMLITGPPNPNPFHLKFITGNIRICQGCRQSLRTTSGLIPDPPYNLVVARSEKRQYRDSSGELVTPSSYSNAHYHVAVSCISRVEPTFHPSTLKIPADITGQLGWEHKSFLYSQLGLMV